MRIFVLGTGRCGTSTFYHACRHALNKTVGHESVYWTQDTQHQYPPNHIEIGHTLTWVVSWLVRRYPAARFVHLQRHRATCIGSLAQYGLGPLRLFHRINRGRYEVTENKPVDLGLIGLYYDELNWRIPAVVPPHRLFHLWLREAAGRWQECWDWMGCRGNFSASLREWGRRYNAAGSGRDTFTEMTG